MDEVLVIDIGGTKTNISFVSSNSSKIEIISSDIIPTLSKYELAINKIASIYNSKEKEVSSISLSLPGKWDKDGVLRESFNLQGWLNFPFIKNLSSELKIKNIIWETDVICGGLGEYYVQSKALHTTSLLYINLGTGIGASLIKDGKSFKSEGGLTLRLQKMEGVDLISGSSLCKVSGYSSTKNLYEDYKLSKPDALNIISSAQTQLTNLLIKLYYLLSPEVIVLAGGLTYDWEVLAGKAIDIANKELNDQVKILPSKLKNLAPIYGAYINYLNLN